MSPGVNDGPRNTGTVPKSNRRSDRNRERSTVNQHLGNHSTHHGYPQHSNNLVIETSNNFHTVLANYAFLNIYYWYEFVMNYS